MKKIKTFKLDENLDNKLKEAKKITGQNINFIIETGIKIALDQIEKNGFLKNNNSSISKWNYEDPKKDK